MTTEPHSTPRRSAVACRQVAVDASALLVTAGPEVRLRGSTVGENFLKDNPEWVLSYLCQHLGGWTNKRKKADLWTACRATGCNNMVNRKC